MKIFIEKEIEKRIVRYVDGKMSESEINELWADLIEDGHYLDYLKTIANLQRTGKKRNSGFIPAFRKDSQLNSEENQV